MAEHPISKFAVWAPLCAAVLAFSAIAWMAPPAPVRAASMAGWSEPSARAWTVKDLDAEITRQGADYEALITLRDKFPTEWEGLAEHLTTMSNSGENRFATRAYIDTFLSRLVRSKADDLSMGPDSALKAVFAAEAGLLKTLKSEKVERCAAYTAYGELPGDSSPNVWRASQRHWSLALSAIRDGLDHPVSRDEPTSQDAAVIAKAFAGRGGTAAEWKASFAGGLDGLPPSQRCDGTLAMMASIGDAPEAVAGRWAAMLVAPGEDSGDDDQEGAPAPRPGETLSKGI